MFTSNYRKRYFGAITLIDATVRVIPLDIEVDATSWHASFKPEKKMEERKLAFIQSLVHEKEEQGVKFLIHLYGWDDKFTGLKESKDIPPLVFGDIHVLFDKSKPMNLDINFYVPVIEIGLKDIAAKMEAAGVKPIKAIYNTDPLRAYLKANT